MSKQFVPEREGMLSSAERGRRKGRDLGYVRGWNHGFHVGQCEAVLRQNSDVHEQVDEKKVIYVTAGIDVPYPALDQAIIEGLREIVTEVIVANPVEDIVLLAETVKPDLVLVLNGVVFPATQVQALRVQAIKTAVWLTDDPYYTDWTMSIAPRYDYVFTLEISCVPLYQSLGCAEVHYLPFGANPHVFHPKRVDYSYHSDICFIGTAFWNRIELIDSIADFLVDKKVVISGWWWDRLKNYNKLSGKIRLGTWMTAEETASYYNGAKIVINLHRLSEDDSINFNREKLPAYSLNPRTFEIAGCGTMQLTDSRQELSNYYIPGSEIATYTNADELISQIDYYLHHEEERKGMAYRALTRTRDEHTYLHRLTHMLHIIFNK